MFGKLKAEILDRFEEILTARNQKIVDLEEKSTLPEKKIKNLSLFFLESGFFIGNLP